jgi:hypothetical protein
MLISHLSYQIDEVQARDPATFPIFGREVDGQHAMRAATVRIHPGLALCEVYG